MAIRFQCSSCTQPIEVDDELARMAVVCPYCRRTITTPAESTLPDPADLPVARGGPQPPVAGSPDSPGWPPAPQPYPGTPEGTGGGPYYAPTPAAVRPPTNRIAVAALIVACLSLVGGLAFALTFRAHRDEFMEHVGNSTDFSQGFQAAQKMIDANGGAPPAWLMAASFSMLLTMALWFTAMVLAIIGLTRPVRQATAGWALGVCFLTVVVFCLGPG